MYKLVKIYDVTVENGLITGAKAKVICYLKTLTKEYILNKIKKCEVILPNFSDFNKTDEDGRNYWNILVWRMDKDGDYAYPLKSIYEFSNSDGSNAEICIDCCEHDIRVNSFVAAICSGFLSKDKIEKVRKDNYIL